jgi:hypothetical protein
MRSNQRNWIAWLSRLGSGLALLVTLSCTTAYGQQEMVSTRPEPGPQQPPAENWFNVDTPGRSALARPDSFLPYGPPPAGICCPGCKDNCLFVRVLAWATYCPKYRVCSVAQCCNSCQFKGAHPAFYLFFLNPKCVSGSGLHATFTNDCYRGCKDCAAGATCGQP